MYQEDGRLRYIEGVDNGDAPAHDGTFEVKQDILVSKFKKFVREFSYNTHNGQTAITSLKYRAQFMENCEEENYRLEVSLNDFSTDSEDGTILHHNLVNRPTEFVKLCEGALQDLYREFFHKDDQDMPQKVPLMQLAFKTDANLDGTLGSTKPKMIRELTSDQVEKLVVIQGIVASVKTPRDKVRKVVLKCSNCENVEEVTVETGFTAAHIPSSCKGNAFRAGQMEKCPPNSFVAVGDLCEYAVDQSIRLQELPEHVPVGEMPRSIELCAQMYDVDRCTPGTRLTCIGVFCATEKAAGDKLTRGRNQGTNTVKYSYIQVLGLQLEQGNQSQGALKISPDEEEYFDKISKDPNIREMIFQSIAPAICASEKDSISQVKRAIASQLFGGSRKHLPSGNRLRGDINVLLLGDPGTAKSQFLKFAHQVAPIAVYTSGKGSSAAGLTAAVVKDGSGFTLEGGAMVLADNGLVCIDEFDKMDENARAILHEVMEQQTVSVAKSGIVCSLNARTAILASANPADSCYNPKLSVVENIKLPKNLMTRFDLIWLMLDRRNRDTDHRLAMHLLSMYSEGGQKIKVEPEVDAETFRRYVTFARQWIFPVISDEAAQVLSASYMDLRNQGSREVITATPRILESLIRISESLAKMELRETVLASDVNEAVRLLKAATYAAAVDPETGLIDWEQLIVGVSAGKRKRMKDLEALLQELMTEKGEAMREDSVKAALNEKLAERKEQLMNDSEFSSAIRAAEQAGILRRHMKMIEPAGPVSG